MNSRQINLSRSDQLLIAREARVLAWSFAARLLFLAIFALLIALHLIGVIKPGMVAQTYTDAVGALGLIAATGIVMYYGLRQARRQQHLRRIGYSAVILDLLFLSMLPLLWYVTLETVDGSSAFLMKEELTVAMVMIVINSLTLRPAYPAIMAGGTIVLHAVLAAIVLSDPLVVITEGYAEHFATPAVNPGVFGVRIFVLVLVGGFLSWLAYAARRTIHDAVELEVTNLEIKERQAELIMDGKMAAMSALVAGVAHEANTPLGVLESSLDTSERCARKLADAASVGGALESSTKRLFDTLSNSGRSAHTAVVRLSKLVSSLKDFVHVDEAELQSADVRSGLDTVLSLVEPEVKGEVEVIKTYGNVPEIVCTPKELNQVFMTILVNAFEAMDGRGTLHLKTSTVDGNVTVDVTDTGPGIPEARLKGLFEIGFGEKKGRMSMSLGLPMGRRIVELHGGTLQVQSRQGEGTTFKISLPIDTNAPSSTEHLSH